MTYPETQAFFDELASPRVTTKDAMMDALHSFTPALGEIGEQMGVYLRLIRHSQLVETDPVLQQIAEAAEQGLINVQKLQSALGTALSELGKGLRQMDGLLAQACVASVGRGYLVPAHDTPADAPDPGEPSE